MASSSGAFSQLVGSDYGRVVASNNATWDMRAAGSDPVLQLWGTTADGPVNYRSFRFESATCSGGNPPTGTNPSDGSYEGYFDGMDCNSAGGWVWNSSYPNQAIVLEIVEGGNVLSTVTASSYRPDLVNAGKGNGQHGFSWSVPGSLKNGQPHTVSVRVQGQGYVLNNAPRTITCSGGARVSAGADEWDGSLSVSPNPTNGRIRVRFGAAAGQAYELQLADLAGRQLESWPVVARGSLVDETLLIPETVQGMVVLQVLRDGRLESKKVIVVR